MVRTVLLALALAFAGGPLASWGLQSLLPAARTSPWKMLSISDPNGLTTEAGGHYDPNGAAATADIISINDPNG